jgi:hypothetical protein
VGTGVQLGAPLYVPRNEMPAGVSPVGYPRP